MKIIVFSIDDMMVVPEGMRYTHAFQDVRFEFSAEVVR